MPELSFEDFEVFLIQVQASTLVTAVKAHRYQAFTPQSLQSAL